MIEEDNKSKLIIEQGDIFLFYRPKVDIEKG
jgi:hypothetical protein